ncbi:MOS1T transposase, partial [Pseudoatta argentina]
QSNFLLVLKMSIFVPNKVYLRGILLHYFIQKKSAAEAHRILVQTYGDNALSDTTCRDWFRRFKNNDFELEDKERSGAPKKFQDKELEQLLDEDPSQTLSELGKILQVDESTVSKRLKWLGMIQKQGHWVPYELKPRDVERRFGTCELLLQRQKRKDFLHRIVTGDEKWITITGDRYRLQLMRLSRALKEKRPLYAQRHNKVILSPDNARPHVAKPVKTYLETLKWEVLPHPPYSPDIAPSDFHLFRSMAHGLADRRFHSYEEAQKWIDSWIASKDMSFFRRGIHVLPERWEKKSAAEAHRILVQTYGDTLQIIKSNRGPIARSTNPLPDPTGRVDLTTKSHGTPRKVDPGKRDIGSRDSAGRIPFIPPNRSRYIGARYTSAQISEPVTLGTGDLAGFPRASRATMRLANSFISIAD